MGIYDQLEPYITIKEEYRLAPIPALPLSTAAVVQAAVAAVPTNPSNCLQEGRTAIINTNKTSTDY